MGSPPSGQYREGNHSEYHDRSDGFFSQLTGTTIQAFERLRFSASYPRGATLYVQGQPPRGVYLLRNGRVKLSVCTADGKGLILQIAEQGELLGLPANVSNQLFEVSAEAIEPCEVDFVEREKFLLFLHQHTDACFRVAEVLNQKYHRAYAQIRSLGLSHSALEKLARLLLEWCDGRRPAASSVPGSEVRMKIGLTHEEIARMIGTSRETVTRLFRELRERETIALRGSTLIVRDRSALERLITT